MNIFIIYSKVTDSLCIFTSITIKEKLAQLNFRHLKSAIIIYFSQSKESHFENKSSPLWRNTKNIPKTLCIPFAARILFWELHSLKHLIYVVEKKKIRLSFEKEKKRLCEYHNFRCFISKIICERQGITINNREI